MRTSLFSCTADFARCPSRSVHRSAHPKSSAQSALKCLQALRCLSIYTIYKESFSIVCVEIWTAIPCDSIHHIPGLFRCSWAGSPPESPRSKTSTWRFTRAFYKDKATATKRCVVRWKRAPRVVVRCSRRIMILRLPLSQHLPPAHVLYKRGFPDNKHLPTPWSTCPHRVQVTRQQAPRNGWGGCDLSIFKYSCPVL